MPLKDILFVREVFIGMFAIWKNQLGKGKYSVRFTEQAVVNFFSRSAKVRFLGGEKFRLGDAVKVGVETGMRGLEAN